MFRAGFANILGRPNVGKSTLLNALLGQKLTITNAKPQTTRHRIFGILNEENLQVVFSDTPGVISEPKYGMQKVMNKWAYSVFEDADVLLLMVDVKDEVSLIESLALRLQNVKVPLFLVINKIDTVSEGKAAECQTAWSEILKADKVFMISALKNLGTKELLKEVKSVIPESPPYFPDDEMSDRPMRFFVSEMIRERILELYHQEIPYSCQIEINSFKVGKTNKGDDITRIDATIFVNRQSQKSIIIGKRGSAIKELGSSARKEIEAFVGTKVFLELYVKVKDGWREDDQKLKRFGYK